MTGDGLFTISMDSVTILVDSVLFRVITRDSGIRRWVLPAGGDHAYDTRDTNKYLLTNNLLFIMDTTGLWKKYNGSMLFYAVQPDTVYHIQDTSLFPYGEVIDYQRENDSTEVIINGTDTANYYSTTIDSSSSEFSIATVRVNDTIRWLENIGPFYQNVTIRAVYGIDAFSSSSETYSLVSFNGTPIFITPTSGVVRNTTPRVKQNIYRGHRRIVWLGNGQKSYFGAGSNRYNIIGRRINNPQGAQLLILH